MKKLNLKKKVISVLTDQEKQSINGGKVAGTTSHSNCSGFLCCTQQPCVPEASMGVGITCLMSGCSN